MNPRLNIIQIILRSFVHYQVWRLGVSCLGLIIQGAICLTFLHIGELNIDSSATYTVRHHSRWLPAFSFNYDRVVISKHSIEVGFSVAQLQAITLHFSSETFQFIISLKCSTLVVLNTAYLKTAHKKAIFIPNLNLKYWPFKHLRFV